MKFKSSISFNGVDTSFRHENNRLIIETGVVRRCRDIVRLMQDRQMRGVSDMRDALSEHYLYRDLYTACKRLVLEGVLRHDGYGRWRITLAGVRRWNRLVPVRNRVREPAPQARRVA